MNETELYSIVNDPGKKTPGGAGTHTGHTGHTGARGQSDHTDEPHNHPPKPKDTNPHDTVPVLYCTGYMYCTGTGKKTPGGAGTHSNLNHGQDTAHTCQISTADRTHARTGPEHPPDTQRAPAHIRDTSDKGGRAHTQANGSHRTRTSQPSKPTNTRTSQPSKPTNTPARPRDDRIRGRRNSRSPGAERSLERSPRPTQKRPPAAHGRLPLPERLPAPARTPSWLAPRRHARRGRRNMKARAADAQQTRSGRRCGRSPR